MYIREVQKQDFVQLLSLYTRLTDHGIPNEIPEINADLEKLWDGIISDKNYHIVAGFIDDELVASCTIIVVPNLTHKQRPYATIENVVTHEDHRNRGYATAVLNFAKEIAAKENCYKIMLMTGTKKEATLHFYEKAGYNRNDKTAFIQWL